MSSFRQLMMKGFHSAKNYINFKKIGNLTINDGVCSGFSSSNWLESENTISLGSSFEIVVKFSLGTTYIYRNQYIVSGKYTRCINIDYEYSYDTMSYNFGSGNSWQITSADVAKGITSVQIGNTYYVKFTYDGSQYKSYVSTNGVDWTQDWQYTSTLTIPAFTLVFGVNREMDNMSYLLGMIDLNETYIKLNGVKYYIQII